MSWGVTATGTKAEVKAALEKQFASCANMCAPGTLEGDDIVAARARMFAAIDALDVTPDPFWDGDKIQASANGSHSWGDSGKETPSSATFHTSVYRVRATQKA